MNCQLSILNLSPCQLSIVNCQLIKRHRLHEFEVSAAHPGEGEASQRDLVFFHNLIEEGPAEQLGVVCQQEKGVFAESIEDGFLELGQCAGFGLREDLYGL